MSSGREKSSKKDKKDKKDKKKDKKEERSAKRQRTTATPEKDSKKPRSSGAASSSDAKSVPLLDANWSPSHLSVIAKPLLEESLEAELLSLVTKSASLKCLRKGVKEVQKELRKKPKSGTVLCLLAGDITPIEVVCHFPILCEEAVPAIPYAYVRSKSLLGTATGTKRSVSVILVQKSDNDKPQASAFTKSFDSLKHLNEITIFKPVKK